MFPLGLVLTIHGMGSTSQEMHGACLCGAVAFELRASQYGPDGPMWVCQCTGCRRWTGAPSLPFVRVVPEHFRVTQGQEQIAHYYDGGSSIRAFCRRCGSSLYQEIGVAYHVCGGVLHDVDLKP